MASVYHQKQISRYVHMIACFLHCSTAVTLKSQCHTELSSDKLSPRPQPDSDKDSLEPDWAIGSVQPFF